VPHGPAHGLQQRRGHRPPRGPRPQRRGVRREGDEDDRDEPDAPPRGPDDPSLPDDDSDPLAIPTWIHDPSGYVYEAVESNRLEGVTATLTQAPASDGPWTVWDAEWFGQTNPL